MYEGCMDIPASSGLVWPEIALTQASMTGELVSDNLNEEGFVINPVKQLSASQTREGEHVAKLLVQEDEIEAWLNNPLEYYSDLYSDILYPQQPPPATFVMPTGSKVVSYAPTTENNFSMQPPAMITSPTGAYPFIPPSRPQQLETLPWIPHEFSYFKRNETEASGLNNPMNQYAVAESINTPTSAVSLKYMTPSTSRSRVSPSIVVPPSFVAGTGANALTGSGARAYSGQYAVAESFNTPTSDVALKYMTPSTSRSRVSPSIVVPPSFVAGTGANALTGSGAKAYSGLVWGPCMMAEDLKRMGRQMEDSCIEVQGIGVLESLDLQNQAQAQAQARNISSSSSNRYRKAEVHNITEKKRRHRINERMTILQELIPRATKLHKADLLDETIVYVKSLQVEVRTLTAERKKDSELQQNTSTMSMGMTSRPETPIPQVFPGLDMLNSTQLGQRYPCPATFQMAPTTIFDPSRVQTIRPSEPPRLNNTTITYDSHQQHYGVGQTPITSILDQDQSGVYDQYN